MILISGEKFEKFRPFLMSDTRSQIFETCSLQIITEEHEGQELVLLSFGMVKNLQGSC